jgi:hypothetical protein
MTPAWSSGLLADGHALADQKPAPMRQRGPMRAPSPMTSPRADLDLLGHLRFRGITAVGWIPGVKAGGGWNRATARAKAVRGSATRITVRPPGLGKSGGTIRQPAAEASEPAAPPCDCPRRPDRKRRRSPAGPRRSVPSRRRPRTWRPGIRPAPARAPRRPPACLYHTNLCPWTLPPVAPTARVHPEAWIGPQTVVGEYVPSSRPTCASGRVLPPRTVRAHQALDHAGRLQRNLRRHGAGHRSARQGLHRRAQLPPHRPPQQDPRALHHLARHAPESVTESATATSS